VVFDEGMNRVDPEPPEHPQPDGKLKRKRYEKQLRELQVELSYLQDWVRETGARIILLFEGRDTAGKGGLIRVMTERVSPRTFRVVALSAPAEGEKKKLFLQRYIERFPAAGEIVIFDRSWYNRAGVDRVMEFATEEEVKGFLENIPRFEQWLVRNGIILIKLWLEVSKEEQERRFRARIEDPLRQWKLSPMDIKSYSRWYDYSKARDDMLKASDHKDAPWYILKSDDKKRARLNGIAHILSLIPYKMVKREPVDLPKRSNRHRYDDKLDYRRVKVVPETC
jgi:polyphosphate kinase